MLEFNKIVEKEIEKAYKKVETIVLKDTIRDIKKLKEAKEVHITTHSGKLEKIPSVNTSSLINKFCKAMSMNESYICSKCYANRLLMLRPSLDKHLVRNSKLLSERLLKKAEIPKFNNLYVRFNSFGELINITHLLNLIVIAKANPNTTFALWSKRYDLVADFIEQDNEFYENNDIPYNMILIYSNPKINPVDEYIPAYFDKVFSVYTKDYIKENNIKINCGGRKCFECKNCYEFNSIYKIREVIK